MLHFNICIIQTMKNCQDFLFKSVLMPVVERIEETLDERSGYYNTNSLRANPDKTQITAVQLKNKEAERSLKVEWNTIYPEKK